MTDARFRPTHRQAMARGLYFGALAALAGVALGLVATLSMLSWGDGSMPPLWVWLLLASGPPVAGALGGALAGRRRGAGVTDHGIRTARAVQPWSDVVDLRAERRGGRTVVSVYLASGRSVQLSAPYSGELFAADPRFEQKVSALSHLWRAHRVGGLPS